MAYAIRVNKEGGKYRVQSYHPNPDRLSDEVLKGTIMIDDMPEREDIPGKRGVLMYDPDKNEAYYEYKDAPEEPKEGGGLDNSKLFDLILDKLGSLEERVARLEKE